ncbi:sacsin N-terminal ATP-binding-like domain-containing protein [Actinomadura luteofluorescens]|uniref:sacsin N-terminal ATP-binding-like domain-containing protein n=1 Tax=Actinomadura luteofluorescens TaxID=46163 RepID=UPI0030CE046F
MTTSPDITVTPDPAGRMARTVDLIMGSRLDHGDDLYEEPLTQADARIAVTLLGERLRVSVPEVVRESLETQRSNGELISSDRLQFLSEAVQNADDVAASEVRVVIGDGELWYSHNGVPVRLRDILAIALPSASTKKADPSATGRFGIGLGTIDAISPLFEVHCEPYHVRFAHLDTTWIAPSTAPPGLCGPEGWTYFRIPLSGVPLTESEMVTWLQEWGDAALLFMQHVAKVTLLQPDGTVLEESRLRWNRLTTGSAEISGIRLPMRRQIASGSDGRRWAVYGVDAATPEGYERKNKASAVTTPVQVALPLDDEAGFLHAGLPVAGLGCAVRINAQFDPLLSRQDISTRGWNQALLPMIGGLWTAAMADLFAGDPASVWRLVPTSATGTGYRLGLEEELLRRARADLAPQLRVEAPPLGGLALKDLAYEAPRLEGLLSPSEVARLGPAAAKLPARARDREGRWREVLRDWQEAGVAVPAKVTVLTALALLSEPERAVSSVLALTAAGLAEQLESRLRELPCVVIADGRRLVPKESAGTVLTTVPIALLDSLGVSARLHEEHLLDQPDPVAVLDWLRTLGVLVETDDVRLAVGTLARLGGSGLRLWLSEDRLRELRSAFDELSAKDQQKLGPDVGRAVLLTGNEYDPDGARSEIKVSPADAYLPARFDRRGFATAAGRTPGIPWLSSRYGDVLKQRDGQGGPSAAALLRLLGAASSPRFAPHEGLEHKYSGKPFGLALHSPDSTAQRRKDLRDLGATYTVDEYDSPTLRAVVRDIARDEDAGRRLERSAALVAVVGRDWDKIKRHCRAKAASDYYGWNFKGDVEALWFREVRTSAWVESAARTPRPPSSLHFCTKETVAVLGAEPGLFVAPELAEADRGGFLSACGVAGAPNLARLVAKLNELKNDGSATLDADVTLVYQGMASLLRRSAGHRYALRVAFARESGLILTAEGWRRPEEVLRGDPIFGSRRLFVPPIPDAEELWEELDIARPGPDDALAVLAELAGRPLDPEPAGVMLNCFRMLARDFASEPPTRRQKDRLRRLRLWTSHGWVRDRPVYTTEDPVLAEALGTLVTVWQPGAELPGFRSLLEWLKITEVCADKGAAVRPMSPWRDDESTALFATAVGLLRDWLVRNDPELEGALKPGWDELGGFEVMICPGLLLSLRLGDGAPVQAAVPAIVDRREGSLLLAEPGQLTQVDGAGRAIAGLFATGGEKIALHWSAACQRAAAGRRAQPVQPNKTVSAEQLAETDRKAGARLTELEEQLTTKTSAAARDTPLPPSTPPAPRPSPPRTPPPAPQATPRQLVDLDTVVFGEPTRSRASGPNAVPATRSHHLTEPRYENSPPQGRSAPRAYTDLDKEQLGLNLLRKVLSRSHREIIDLRAQHGVGADAIDDLRKFYELKVYAAQEPNTIRLAATELERALRDENFILVIISNLEGPNARPRLRFITDPLHRLRPQHDTVISLTGIQNAPGCLVIDATG